MYDGMTAVREWTHSDDGVLEKKSDWGEGPWQTEPDKIQWLDAETQLDCLMHRNGAGAWCGYVGVPESHPSFEKHYDDVAVDVHGGLTYADFCADTTDESRGICHVPLPGRPHRVWWLGFDCHHCNDLAPAMRSGLRFLSARLQLTQFERDTEVYRDRTYVENEVRSLAKQLAEIAAG